MADIIIGTIVVVLSGAFTGFLARLVLPGAQKISLGKTVGIGMVANIISALLMSAIFGPSVGRFAGLVAGVIIGVIILYIGIQKSWIRPEAA